MFLGKMVSLVPVMNEYCKSIGCHTESVLTPETSVK